MIGASLEYYTQRAREARASAARASCQVVRDKYIELARVYEFNARRAAPVRA